MSVSRAKQMSYRRMVWSILSIAACAYAGLCLFFFIFQRSFIYMPTPARVEHDAAIPLEVPGARLRITTRPLDGPKALVYFGGTPRPGTPQAIAATHRQRPVPTTPRGLRGRN